MTGGMSILGEVDIEEVEVQAGLDDAGDYGDGVYDAFAEVSVEREEGEYELGKERGWSVRVGALRQRAIERYLRCSYPHPPDQAVPRTCKSNSEYKTPYTRPTRPDNAS